MLDLVRWGKKVRRKETIPLNDAILHEKAGTTDQANSLPANPDRSGLNSLAAFSGSLQVGQAAVPDGAPPRSLVRLAPRQIQTAPPDL